MPMPSTIKVLIFLEEENLLHKAEDSTQLSLLYSPFNRNSRAELHLFYADIVIGRLYSDWLV